MPYTIPQLKELLEKAKPIKSFPGYFVTRDGRVLSTATNWRGYGVRELKQHLNSHGYLRVHILNKEGRKNICVHSLVARHFLPPRPSEHHEVRHLDGDRTNNNSKNLKWGTRKENADDRAAHGMTAKGERNGWAKLSDEKVRTIKRLSEQGIVTKIIAKKFQVTPELINSILRKKAWKHVK